MAADKLPIDGVLHARPPASPLVEATLDLVRERVRARLRESGQPWDAFVFGDADRLVTAADIPLGPGVEFADATAKAIDEACKQYPLGIAVVNSIGEPILVRIPDRSKSRHAYAAIRKAYSAITFKVDGSKIVAKGQTDPAFAAQVKADPNLMAYSGGVLLKVGDKIVGAVGASGAEPGGHDEECVLAGLAKTKAMLK